MATDSAVNVRAIAWRELIPCLRLLRVFRLAIRARVLVLAALGVVLTAAAWGLLGWVLRVSSGPDGPDRRLPDSPAVLDLLVPDRPPLLASINEPLGPPIAMPAVATNPLVFVWRSLSAPLLEALDVGVSAREMCYLLLGGLASLAIWSLFGGAITRAAAVELAGDEEIGMVGALRYAASRWVSYFGAPLFPIAGILLAAAPVWLFGWLLRFDAGLLVAGLIWPLLLVGGFVMALLAAGLLFGWPLMWASTSTEGTDSFDALSRSHAYVYQRPLHYLAYFIVAAVVGWLGWLVVENFAAGVVWLTYWAAAPSGGAARIGQLLTGSPARAGVAKAGAGLIHFWTGCVKLLAVAYLFSYFWSAASGVYLLLRRDVDGTEMDEVFLDADEDEQRFELPTIRTDAAGAPEVADHPNPPQPPASGTDALR